MRFYGQPTAAAFAVTTDGVIYQVLSEREDFHGVSRVDKLPPDVEELPVEDFFPEEALGRMGHA